MVYFIDWNRGIKFDWNFEFYVKYCYEEKGKEHRYKCSSFDMYIRKKGWEYGNKSIVTIE